MRYLVLLFILLSSCEVKVNTGKEDKQTKPARNKSKIRNGIEVEVTGGLQVEQAFLTYVEDGSFVGEDNVTTINKPVKLNLVVKGWKAKEDQVYLDAEEKITTSEKDVILDQKDMFNGIGSVSPKDAEYLNFQFVITRLNKIFDYFLVETYARNKEFDQTLKVTVRMHVE